MKNSPILLLLLLMLSSVNVCFVRANVTIDSFSMPGFDEVHVYAPAKQPKSVAILISGDAGWKYGVLNFAGHFAKKDHLIIGVDILKYLKNLRNKSDDCYNITADFITLATNIEKKYHLPNYQTPILMGYSSGATLVYALLAQARPNTFKGGISLGFCPDIRLSKPFCHLNGLEEEIAAKGKGFVLEPDLKLGNRWIVLHGKLDKICNYNQTLNFIKKTSDAALITLDSVGHGFSEPAKFMPQWDKVYQSLLDTPSNTPNNLSLNEQSLQDLPLDLTNAKIYKKDAPFLVFLSGDGGWYSFEQRISDRLAAEGIPTVGLDTKRYFWNRRTPEATTKDIERVLEIYETKWKKHHFILMGYSMGAEVLPFILNRLPPTQQAMIQSIVLLSPRPMGDFEVHFSSMLGLGSFHDDYNVQQEIASLPPLFQQRTLVVFGDAEHSLMPAQLCDSSVRFATVHGDHHYYNNSAAIVEAMKKNGIVSG